MLKRALTAGLLGLAAAAVAQPGLAAQAVTLFAIDNYPPFAFEDAQSKQAKGIYVQILAEALKGIEGFEVEIKASPWRRAVAAAQQGKGLGVFPAYVGSKEPGIAGYSKPILTEIIVAVCTDNVFDAAARRTWPDDYLGLTLGRNVGSSYGGEGLADLVKQRKIALQDGGNTRGNMQKLFQGRIDCFMTENLAYLLEVKAMGEEGLYDRTRAAPVSKAAEIKREQAAVGFRTDDGKFPFQRDFAAKLDARLEAMTSSGRIDDIIADYLR